MGKALSNKERVMELGILFLCLALLRKIEPRIGVRENGVFYVFGQTAML